VVKSPQKRYKGLTPTTKEAFHLLVPKNSRRFINIFHMPLLLR
jgi:hypothetical protein